MSLHCTITRAGFLGLGLAVTLGLGTPAAHAGYTISASYNLGTASAAGATAVGANSCGSAGADALLFTGSGANSIGIHTYGCEFDNGFGGSYYSFGSRSSGENTYFVNGSMALNTTLATNSIDFFVNPGQIGAFGSNAFGAGEFQRSSLSVKLTIDGNIIIDDSWYAEVGTGGALTTNHTSTGSQGLGYNLTTGAGYASYQLFGGSLFVDNLGAGSHVIDYLISSEASGNISSTTVCRAPYTSGGIEATIAIIEGGGGEPGGQGNDYAAYCGAGSQSGDPFPSLSRALPEPGSAALFGVALLGLIGGSRRRVQVRS
jgi:hypothetical protein